MILLNIFTMKKYFWKHRGFLSEGSEKMAAYFEKQGIAHADEVTESDLKAYVSEMQSADFASSTISRNIASIRALFHYLFKKAWFLRTRLRI